MLRNTPGMLRSAVAVNLLACLVWFVCSAYVSPGASADTIWQLCLQLLVAGTAGAIALVPVALTQNAVMDRIGVPPAAETP
jgi:3-methyladenine DNA glycosylase/8-oxoguanine DNA glycosylase